MKKQPFKDLEKLLPRVLEGFEVDYSNSKEGKVWKADVNFKRGGFPIGFGKEASVKSNYTFTYTKGYKFMGEMLFEPVTEKEFILQNINTGFPSFQGDALELGSISSWYSQNPKGSLEEGVNLINKVFRLMRLAEGGEESFYAHIIKLFQERTCIEELNSSKLRFFPKRISSKTYEEWYVNFRLDPKRIELLEGLSIEKSFNAEVNVGFKCLIRGKPIYPAEVEYELDLEHIRVKVNISEEICPRFYNEMAAILSHKIQGLGPKQSADKSKTVHYSKLNEYCELVKAEFMLLKQAHPGLFISGEGHPQATY